MKKKLIGLIILLGGPASFAGGVSGGGGNLPPKNPATIQDIRKIVDNRKFQLRLVIKKELFDYPLIQENPYDAGSWKNATEADKKLYLGSPNVAELLESTQVDLMESEPCYDNAGNPVDGSINGNTSKSICISAYLIAPKVEKTAASGEVLALIMHELSHFILGAQAEDEAIIYQKRMLNKLGLKNDFYADHFIREAWINTRDTAESIHFIIDQLSDISSPNLTISLALFEERIFSLKHLFFDECYGLVDRKEFNDFWITRYKARNAVEYGYTLVESNPNGQKHQDYDAHFQGKKQIPFKNWFKNYSPGLLPMEIENEPITRINTKEEMISELMNVNEKMSRLAKKFENFLAY